MSVIARELDYSSPQESGTPQIDFPFDMNGDFTSITITRHFKQTYAGFSADRRANRFPMGLTVDTETGGYLVATSKPALTITGLQSFDRTFARIPLTQSVPSSLLLTKPTLPLQTSDQIVGDYYLNRPNSAKESYDAYLIKTVSSDGGPPSLYPTGGTYTLTFGASTTAALAFNAAAATVQTALNGLASVIAFGSVTVTGAYNTAGGLVVTFSDYAIATINGSLTDFGGAATITDISASITYFHGRYQTRVYYNTTHPGSPITGGTFTVTIFGQTTAAIAWNATQAQVQAAMNLLSEVIARGGVTVLPGPPLAGDGVGSNSASGTFGFSFTMTNPNLSSSVTSLTPAPSAIDQSAVDSGTVQTLQFSAVAAGARVLFFSSAHGIVSTDTVFILADGVYYSGRSGIFTIVSPNTIQIDVSGGAAYATATAITAVGKRTKAGYKPGTTVIRCLKNTAFYLPGVSAGISSFGDIPLPDNQSDPATFLAAVFAGSGNLNWQIGEITPWMGTILQQTTTTIDVEDI